MLPRILLKNFRFASDQVPISIFIGLFLVDVLVFSLNLPILITFIYALVAFFPKTMITAWNHHHQHVPTFRNPVLNMVLEVIYGFQTGVLPHGWVLHHNLGHHPNYMKGAKDESSWLTKSGRKMGEVEYTFRVSLMAYVLIARNILKYEAKHGLRFSLGLVLTVGIFAIFWSINPINAVLLFLLPGIGGLFGTVWHTYKHHSGLATDIAEEASWNMMDPFYNLLTGNLGYHTAHHISCGTHWSKLPALHDRISHKIPKTLYREPGFPFPMFKAIATVAAPKWVSSLVSNPTT